MAPHLLHRRRDVPFVAELQNLRKEKPLTHALFIAAVAITVFLFGVRIAGQAMKR
jgi:hypothetical protein